LRAEPSFWLTPGIIVALLAAPASAHAADLNLIPDASIVATNVALFLLLVYPVNKLLVSPFIRVLDERAERTTGALSRSEGLRDEARASRTELEAKLAEARTRAVARRNEILAEGEVLERAELEAAREESERAVQDVRRSVQAELSDARGTLQADARALAREVATRILGRAL
jgi:F-type H+-transporting ATPase subunit b